MTTPAAGPSGILKWGQAGTYDAWDDREVIAAVTRYRTGLCWPASLRTGNGLELILEGGWLGVTDCGDRTSAVVGSRTDLSITANPGPASGSRSDVLWCDVQPDDATWSLAVIPATDVPGRPGIPLAFITAPAGASLASQLGIVPADASLERRLVASQFRQDTRVITATSWQTAPTIAWATHTAEPGQWYRVVFESNSIMPVTGSQQASIGVGWHACDASDNTSILGRGAVVSAHALNLTRQGRVEWVFRHPVTAAPSCRSYDGRIWIRGTGSLRVNSDQTLGWGLQILVEDIGS